MARKVGVNKIHKYLSGECTPQERRELENRLETDASHRDQFQEIKKIWEVEPKEEVIVNAKSAWEDFARKENISTVAPDTLGKDRKKIGRVSSSINPISEYRFYYRIAAILLVGLLVSVLYNSLLDNTQQRDDAELASNIIEMQDVATGIGQTKTMRFTDRTSIKLNSASSLRLPKNLAGDRIEIYLEGEAYFDFKRTDNREIVVYAGDAEINVTGTGFNVKAWPDEEVVEVAVRNGEVSVKSTPVNGMTVLSGGKKSLISRGQAPSPPIDVDGEHEFGWLDGTLHFYQNPMSAVIRQLERKYHVTFAVSDSSIYSIPLTAVFKHESLDDILDMIAVSTELEFLKEEGQVTFVRPESPAL